MLAKQAVYVKTELEIILKIVNISNHFSTQNKQALCFPSRKLRYFLDNSLCSWKHQSTFDSLLGNYFIICICISMLQNTICFWNFSYLHFNILYHKIDFVQQTAINHALFQFIFSIIRTPLSVQCWAGRREGNLVLARQVPGIITGWRYSSCVDSTAIKIELWPAQNISFHCKHRPGPALSARKYGTGRMVWENTAARNDKMSFSNNLSFIGCFINGRK